MDKAAEKSAAASQRGDKGRKYKQDADRAKEQLRYAKRVERVRATGGHSALRSSFDPSSPLMSQEQEDALRWNLRTGALRERANEQDRRWGSGRLWHPDESFIDIGGNADASISRAVLDRVDL